jgi:hypothetical protein
VAQNVAAWRKIPDVITITEAKSRSQSALGVQLPVCRPSAHNLVAHCRPGAHSVTPASDVHASMAFFAYVGMGIVRTRPCFPTRSTMHQRLSRC